MEPTLFGFSYVMQRDHRKQQMRIDARRADDIGLVLPGRLPPIEVIRPHGLGLRWLVRAMRGVVRWPRLHAHGV